MATPLSLRTERRADATVAVVATGEIDLSNVDAFADALAAAESVSTTFTVDLGGVEYLDSGAINALYTHAEHIHVIANPVLLPVLKISGLADVASVVPSSP